MDVKQTIAKEKASLERIDPYASVYIHAKAENPDKKLYVAQFRKSDVDAVDYLVKLSRGKRDEVKTSEDWMIVAKLFEFWTRRWREEWVEFAQSIKEIRATRARKDGRSESREIKYVGAIPIRFQQLIKAIFPLQQFDKEFVNKLTKNIKIIEVGEKTETYFSVPTSVKDRLSTEQIVEKTLKKANVLK